MKLPHSEAVYLAVRFWGSKGEEGCCFLALLGDFLEAFKKMKLTLRNKVN